MENDLSKLKEPGRLVSAIEAELYVCKLSKIVIVGL